MMETKFYFKDEFENETETRKTYTKDSMGDTPAIEFLFIDFKNHLKNCGFTDENIQEYAGYHFGESDNEE